MKISARTESMIQIALALAQKYLQLAQQPPPVFTAPYDEWEAILKLERQLQRAYERKYFSLVPTLKRQLVRGYENLSNKLSTRQQIFCQQHPTRHPPSARQLFEELQALDEEFEEVQFDEQKLEIIVPTESIELEEIELGIFELKLSVNDIGSSTSVRVSARDPNTPSTNDEVTHPHVQSEKLCMGEGKLAIDKALQSGRLQEFFLLIQQVLKNYNSESAYMKLENWHGIHCKDCAGTMLLDDAYYCDECNEAICMDCDICCQSCSGTACSSCSSLCAHCNNYFCQHCNKECDDCGEQLCHRCNLDELTHTCLIPDESEEDTYEEEVEEYADEPATLESTSPSSTTPETVSPQAATEIHPHCLG